MSATTPLYVTDGEIARLLGIPMQEWKANAAVLNKGGLPKPDTLFGGRRYWPAVKAFLDRRHGLDASSGPLQPDGEENFDAIDQRRPRAKGPKA